MESNPGLAANGLLGAADGTKALLELVDTSLGVNEGALTGVERVRVGSEADRNDEVLHSVDLLGLVRLGGGTGDETVTSGHVLEDYGMVVGMDVFFHGMPLKVRVATLPTPQGAFVVPKWARCQLDFGISSARNELENLRDDGSPPFGGLGQHRTPQQRQVPFRSV